MKRDSFTRISQHKDGTYYVDSLAPAEDLTIFVYDNITRVVYYRDKTFMCPYVSVHGKFCKFIDNKFVAIG